MYAYSHVNLRFGIDELAGVFTHKAVESLGGGCFTLTSTP